MVTGIRVRQEAPGHSDVSMATSAVTGPIAWRRQDLKPEDWIVPVTGAALAELDTIADALGDLREPVEELTPDAFDWPAMTEVMVDVRTRLEHGIGFAILDRLPVERWGKQASTGIAWLLTNLLAPAIKQKWKGARIYDVRDTKATLQYGVRRSVTNLEQEFHTDGSFASVTPEIIGLGCLQDAATGGMSRLASLVTVHNDLLAKHVDELARLHSPFWWDRQAEHAPDEPPASWLPVFSWEDGRMRVRYYDDYIRNGYKHMGAEIDDAGLKALSVMKMAVESPDNWVELRLQPGQIEYTNNLLIAHGRTAFRDEGDHSHARHLLRFWLRSIGGLELEPDPPAFDRTH